MGGCLGDHIYISGYKRACLAGNCYFNLNMIINDFNEKAGYS